MHEVQRTVKLGRRPLQACNLLVAHHWAVQVVDNEDDEEGFWYELNGASKSDSAKRNEVIPYKFTESKIGAGHFGGEPVGKTEKTNTEINAFIRTWLDRNEFYGFTSSNCQKFGIEFIQWLTNGKYRIKHLGDAATTTKSAHTDLNVLIESKGRKIIAKGIWKQVRIPYGMVMLKARGPYSEYDKRNILSLYGPGYGIWGEVSAMRLEVGLAGLASIYTDLNANTGIGMRGVNFDFHLLGFGFAVGSDGFAVDTPIGGTNLRILSWPINFVDMWLRSRN